MYLSALTRNLFVDDKSSLTTRPVSNSLTYATAQIQEHSHVARFRLRLFK